MATQTAFATAVSEVARSLIDKASSGRLSLIVDQREREYQLIARLDCEKSVGLDSMDSGFLHAGKLVAADFHENEETKTIQLTVKIASSPPFTSEMVAAMVDYFAHLPPQTPYEEVKIRNQELYAQADKQEAVLQHSLYVNEQKDAFIAMTGHELKTPLTLIKAYSQLALQLERENQTSPTMQSYIEKIDQQAKKMHELIQQLLDISIIEKGTYSYKKEKVRLVPFIKDVCAACRQLLPDHQIELSLDEDREQYVYIDKLRMEQALDNLIGNAGKYSRPGTKIRLSCLKDGEAVTISIHDEGIGIPKEDLKKIFDKFYRVKNTTQGYTGIGMGLYITSSILKAHDTVLRVESTDGEGSTFFFRLPLVTLPPASPL
jgi:signal transduction histidine kinase